MTDDRARLGHLQDMAAMVLDARSQALRSANAVRDGLVRQLEALEPAPPEVGPLWQSAELARFGYDQWAAGRRAELNVRLAAQTAICLAAAEEARIAFGRKMALERLREARGEGQVS